MKAVFSFWNTSGNALIQATNWANPKFQLYSWVLAVHRAAKFFDEVELVTDSSSLPIFEALKLPFTKIRTDLDELKDYPKSFWALGKIKAYQIQDKPFVHIDNDFILFQPLPKWMLEARVAFQNREGGEWFENCYRGQVDHLTKVNKVPSSWGLCNQAYNMGIYVCNDLEYNQEYCKQAFELVNNNIDEIVASGHPAWYAVVYEQYLAATVAEQLKTPITLFSEPFSPAVIEALGAIHIWGAKQDLFFYNNIERIVLNEYPEQYITVNKLISSTL